jgi:pimeloyl-ACP methyl ester carboxylesterase
LQCARVRFPLDWARRGVGTISLAVIRYLASRPGKRIGSLFVDYGGPGVAGVPIVRAGGAELDKLGQGRFDVVGWDPRGTGTSTHVRCFANAGRRGEVWGRDWSVPTTKRASAQYMGKTVAFVRRCVALSGRLLGHVSTPDTLRDLDYLRRLVGDRRLTYRGLSYGTFIGQTYANMFPRRVRAIVLDAVLDPRQLSDGDLLLYVFATLGRPASWPRIAAGLEQAAAGDGSLEPGIAVEDARAGSVSRTMSRTRQN